MSSASTPSRSSEPAGGPSASATTHVSAKPSGEAVAVTVRDDFLLELGEALGGHISVRPVDSLDSALEHLLASRRLQILLIDARDAADPRAEADRAHTGAPHVPLIVFTAADAEKTVAGALKSSNAFAVLPIPVDPRKTAAVFEGALADAAKRAAAPRAERAAHVRGPSRSTLAPEAEPAAMPAGAEREPHSRKKLLASVIAVLAVVAGAAAIGLAVRNETHSAATARAHEPHVSPAIAGANAGTGARTSSGAGAAAAAPRTAAPAPLVQGTLDELLEKARLAMRERRYTDPADNCALLYYRSALKVDPASGEARDGMTRLAGLLTSRFEQSMSAGHYDEAAGAIADLKVAEPGNPRLGPLEARLLQAEINKALADGNIDRATALVRQAQQSSALPPAELAKWRAELARDQSDARARQLADLFAERVREGRLVDPSNDSAKYYLRQLEALAPGNPVAQHGARDLIAASLAKARDAEIGGHSQQAARWVAEARADGMTSADLSAYQQEIAAARAKAATAEADRLGELARGRIQDGHLTDPEEDSAVYYLTQLKSTAGETPAVRSIGHELAASLIERATTAARAGNTARMSSDLDMAQRWGADPALVQAVEQIANGPRKAGAGLARQQRSGIPPGYVPKRIRYTAPEYPEAALDAHLSGSVTVEFTVDLRGRPRDVRVVASNPHGTFDYAAISAVSRWRFAPPVIDNVPTEIPTRTVIRFTAPN